MSAASIPVDLLNPGQVFACLGFMEAAEILCGPCEGSFAYKGAESSVDFVLKVDGAQDPVVQTLRFLFGADVQAVAPRDSELSTHCCPVEDDFRFGKD